MPVLSIAALIFTWIFNTILAWNESKRFSDARAAASIATGTVFFTSFDCRDLLLERLDETAAPEISSSFFVDCDTTALVRSELDSRRFENAKTDRSNIWVRTDREFWKAFLLESLDESDGPAVVVVMQDDLYLSYFMTGDYVRLSTTEHLSGTYRSINDLFPE